MKRRHLSTFVRKTDGSISILFSLMFVVVLTISGLAIDMLRAHDVRNAMQQAVDSAALAAAAGMPDGERYGVAKKYYSSRNKAFNATLTGFDVAVDSAAGKITVSAAATLPTSLMRAAGFDLSKISVTSSVGIAKPYGDFHFLIDVSESMNIGASPAAIKALEDATKNLPNVPEPDGCAFGCHIRYHINFEPPGKTMFDVARDNGIQLRADVVSREMKDLADELISLGPNFVRVGVAHFSDTFDNRLPLSNDVAEVQNAIDDVRITRSVTMLNSLGTDVANFIGTPGDGAAPDRAKKYVVLATDGAMGATEPKSALSLNLCNALKAQNVTIAVLYMPQYQIRSQVYDMWIKPSLGPIENNIEQCASEPSLFASARSPSEIAAAVKTISANLRKVQRRITN